MDTDAASAEREYTEVSDEDGDGERTGISRTDSFNTDVEPELRTSKDTEKIHEEVRAVDLAPLQHADVPGYTFSQAGVLVSKRMDELDTRLGNIETLLRSVAVSNGSRDAANVHADGGTHDRGQSKIVQNGDEGNHDANGAVDNVVEGDGRPAKGKARRSALWRLRPCGA